MARICVPAARVVLGALAALGVLAALPVAAQAHGPVAPIASSFLARVGTPPTGVTAKVIDGDQRLWLQVPRSETVVVLDYRGAPYVRFTRAGVEINRASAMYYLNRTPTEVPPSNLTRTTPPRWVHMSGDHRYIWHDGRLHALATTALAPATSYMGRWSVPITVDGRLSAVSGGMWHAEDPSIAWFWPIVVMLACVLAARRVRRPELDSRLARVLAILALVATAAAGLGRDLHGRPTVSIFQAITLALIAGFVAWGLGRVLFGAPGYFTYFVIAFLALWHRAELLPTLLSGFVLAAVPASVARAAAAVGWAPERAC